jgi:hypothetical protein
VSFLLHFLSSARDDSNNNHTLPHSEPSCGILYRFQPCLTLFLFCLHLCYSASSVLITRSQVYPLFHIVDDVLMVSLFPCSCLPPAFFLPFFIFYFFLDETLSMGGHECPCPYQSLPVYNVEAGRVLVDMHRLPDLLPDLLPL